MPRITQEERNQLVVDFTVGRKVMSDYFALLPQTKPQYVRDIVTRLVAADRLYSCRAKLDCDIQAVGHYFSSTEERDAFKADYELMSVKRAREKERARDIERAKRMKAERAASRSGSSKIAEKMAINKRISEQYADRKASNRSGYELTKEDMGKVRVLPGFEGKPRHWVNPESIPRFRYGGGGD